MNDANNQNIDNTNAIEKENLEIIENMDKIKKKEKKKNNKKRDKAKDTEKEKEKPRNSVSNLINVFQRQNTKPEGRKSTDLGISSVADILNSESNKIEGNDKENENGDDINNKKRSNSIMDKINFFKTMSSIYDQNNTPLVPKINVIPSQIYVKTIDEKTNKIKWVPSQKSHNEEGPLTSRRNNKEEEEYGDINLNNIVKEQIKPVKLIKQEIEGNILNNEQKIENTIINYDNFNNKNDPEVIQNMSEIKEEDDSKLSKSLNYTKSENNLENIITGKSLSSFEEDEDDELSEDKEEQNLEIKFNYSPEIISSSPPIRLKTKSEKEKVDEFFSSIHPKSNMLVEMVEEKISPESKKKVINLKSEKYIYNELSDMSINNPESIINISNMSVSHNHYNTILNTGRTINNDDILFSDKRKNEIIEDEIKEIRHVTLEDTQNFEVVSFLRDFIYKNKIVLIIMIVFIIIIFILLARY